MKIFKEKVKPRMADDKQAYHHRNYFVCIYQERYFLEQAGQTRTPAVQPIHRYNEKKPQL